MATSVIERTIIMLAPAGVVVDENAIHQDALILQACGLSQGNRMWVSAARVDTVSGGNYTIRTGLSMVFHLLSADDTTVTSGAPAFVARWPGWAIVTHARNLSLG